MPSSSDLSFANQDLRNCSFRQQYLRGADFSGSDIRGCDFGEANLIGANFKGAIAGFSHKQIVALVVSIISFAVAYVDAIAFAIAGHFFIAVAITLTTSVLAVLTSSFTFSLIFCTLLAALVNVSGLWEFSVAIAIAFSLAAILSSNRTLISIFIGAIAFSFMVATVFGFAGNLASTLTAPSVFTVGITFGGIVAFIVVDGDRDFCTANTVGRFAIAATAAGNCLVAAVLAIAIAHQSFLADHPEIELIYILFAIAAIASGLILGTQAIKRVRYAVGTSFQNANLTDARFDYAVMHRTDFSGAELSRVSWKRAQMRKCFARYFYPQSV